jgi:hypothetical protein
MMTHFFVINSYVHCSIKTNEISIISFTIIYLLKKKSFYIFHHDSVFYLLIVCNKYPKSVMWTFKTRGPSELQMLFCVLTVYFQFSVTRKLKWWEKLTGIATENQRSSEKNQEDHKKIAYTYITKCQYVYKKSLYYVCTLSLILT